MIFLIKYQKFLDNQKLNQRTEWYEKMSICVGDSNIHSCGVYHRNYLKKFHTIQGIIDDLKESLIYEGEELEI